MDNLWVLNIQDLNIMRLSQQEDILTHDIQTNTHACYSFTSDKHYYFSYTISREFIAGTQIKIPNGIKGA